MNPNLLIKEIQNNIQAKIKADEKLSKMLAALKTGEGKQKELYKYAEVLADMTNLAIGEVLVDEVVTAELEGLIGTEIVAYILKDRHKHLIDIAEGIERAKLRAQKISFNPVKVEVTETRVADIVAKYNAVASAEELKALTAEKIINQFYGASLDEFCEANASFQYDAGLTVTLVRIAAASSCPFCNKLAGVYEYDGTPECGTGENLFARHTGCTCTIDVRTRKGNQFERVNNYRR